MYELQQILFEYKYLFRVDNWSPWSLLHCWRPRWPRKLRWLQLSSLKSIYILIFNMTESNINIHSATTTNTNFGDKIMKLRKAKLDMIQLSWDWSKLINYLVFHSIFVTCILFVVFVCLNTIVWKLSSSLVKCYWNLETNLYPNNCTQLWRSQVKNICNYCLCTKLF